MTGTESTEQALADAQACLFPIERASSLPPATFNDPGWFQIECERVLQAGWIAVARSAQLAESNQFITTTIGDEPCVVVRNRDGLRP